MYACVAPIHKLKFHREFGRLSDAPTLCMVMLRSINFCFGFGLASSFRGQNVVVRCLNKWMFLLEWCPWCLDIWHDCFCFSWYPLHRRLAIMTLAKLQYFSLSLCWGLVDSVRTWWGIGTWSWDLMVLKCVDPIYALEQILRNFEVACQIFVYYLLHRSSICAQKSKKRGMLAWQAGPSLSCSPYLRRLCFST